MKVIVIGAGAIGMMQARDLALRGIEVVIIDKQQAGAEASWAGGGIVSPLYPWRYSQPVTTLASWSQSYYPNLAESLEAESGVDPELTRHGLLMLNIEDREAALSWAQENDRWMEEISKEKVYQLEPNLREGIASGLWMSQVASIRNPRLLSALKRSLSALSNVELIEHAKVKGFILAKGIVEGVELEVGEKIRADAVLICAGSWSGQFTKEQEHSIDVTPVKGQMLLFKAEPGLVNRVVLSDGKYVIPRRDGSVLAGSTLEHTGYEKQTTEEAKAALGDMAINLFPDLASCQIVHHWAGLRPCAPEGVPYIGPVEGLKNLYVNAGHYRNGLVLAPASVNLLSAMICNEAIPFDPAPYLPANRVAID